MTKYSYESSAFAFEKNAEQVGKIVFLKKGQRVGVRCKLQRVHFETMRD
jgi:hypothetical protein